MFPMLFVPDPVRVQCSRLRFAQEPTREPSSLEKAWNREALALFFHLPRTKLRLSHDYYSSQPRRTIQYATYSWTYCVQHHQYTTRRYRRASEGGVGKSLSTNSGGPQPG